MAWGLAAFLLVAFALVAWWPSHDASGPSESVSTGKPAATVPGIPGGSDPTAPEASGDAEVPRTIEAVTESGIAFKVTEAPEVRVPSPPFAAHYDELLHAAEGGDPASQYALGLMLYRCRDVAANEAALRAVINDMYQTRRLDGWAVDDPAIEERTLRQAFADCGGVPAQARSEYRPWLQRAAEAGLMQAQLNLMFHLPQGEYCQYLADCSPGQRDLMDQLRQEARVHVGRAREAGSVEALRILGGWAVNDEMGTPDPLEAYAYFLAYEQAKTAAGQGGELKAMLDGLESRLRPVDLDEARERADALLANPNCCVLTR